MTKLSGADVKRIRARTGMTQKAFSQAFGINLSTLRHWELGDRTPSGSSATLLQLIEKSPAEVFSVLGSSITRHSPESSPFNRERTKKIVSFGNYNSLAQAINAEPSAAADLILHLLSANGFPIVKCLKEDGLTKFIAGSIELDLREVLSFDSATLTYSGIYREPLEKTFLLALAIETELSEAMFLPHEMRQDRIQNAIRRADADTQLYSLVLKNW